MPQCPTCGAALDAAARFCPKDGTTMRAEPRVTPARGTPTEPARATADPIVGALVDGRYRIKARLGQGGVGAVYAGEHIETLRPVAVKVLHAVFAGTDEFHKRFEREARAASKLSHPACVSVLDYGRIERVEPIAVGAKLLGIPYLVMEFVRGRPLADRVGEKMPPAEAVAIARGVLSALRHAHGLGIVHRDIKPANIMLVDDVGTGLLVKLLDFGLAKDAGDLDAAEPLTQAGMVFGTPGYLSPEQAAGKPADARSDLYALGIVLYELVAGRRPFVRADPLDVVRDHLTTQPPSLRGLGVAISPELEAVIARALAKDPAARWASADELSAALATVPELRPAGAEIAAPVAAPAPLASSAPSPLAGSSPSPSSVGSAAAAALARAGATASQRVARARAAASRTLARAATAWRALAPLRRRQAIAGAVVAVAAVLAVALAAAHRAPPPPPAPMAVPAPPPSLPPPLPESARRHLAQAAAYQRKLWCSDALEELERALRDAPELRDDPELQREAIACLTPKTRDKATHFLVERVGPAARAALAAAASSDGNAEVRRGAEAALARLR